MRVMVIGAAGFIGSHLCPYLAGHAHRVIAASRNPVGPSAVGEAIEQRQLDVLQAASTPVDFSGVDCVVYLAARAHVLREDAPDPLAEYRHVNRDAALELARQAGAQGVSRFIYLSSIGVNGVQSMRPFRETDTPNPTEPYAVSKLEAEQALVEACVGTGMEWVFLRPVLVYGRGAPGNFARLLDAVASGRWLPVGGIVNHRSLLAVDNLVHLVELCLRHPQAANQLFLAADGDDVSTPELARRIGIAIGKPARLLALPPALLKLAGRLLGKRHEVERLCGSLQADIGKAREVLGWQPPLSLRQALERLDGNCA